MTNLLFWGTLTLVVLVAALIELVSRRHAKETAAKLAKMDAARKEAAKSKSAAKRVATLKKGKK